MKNRYGGVIKMCRWVGNGSPRRPRAFEQGYITVKSDIEKQRHSSRTTIGQTLRGVTMKKMLWGRNKAPKIGNDAKLEINVLALFFGSSSVYAKIQE